MATDKPTSTTDEAPYPSETDPRRLRFGDFEFLAGSGELLHRHSTGRSKRVRLQPQPAKVLLYLAERSGELVTREELQRHLWSSDHFVDYDQGLNYCIRAVRRALGDDASAPRYLETIPRRGYRFRRAVEIANGPSKDWTRGLLRMVPLRRASRPARLRQATLVAAAIAVFSVALHWVLWSGLLEAGRPPKLAVMPLEDHSSTESGAALASSLTDELISELASRHAEELGVIARTSSVAAAGRGLTAAELGAKLGVDYLLTGGMQRSHDATRITVQLIRVRDETNLWAEIYEQPLDQADWNRWVQTVSLRVAERLALTLPNKDLPSDSSWARPASSSRTARSRDPRDVSG